MFYNRSVSWNDIDKKMECHCSCGHIYYDKVSFLTERNNLLIISRNGCPKCKNETARKVKKWQSYQKQTY